jgi:hypothetical protein
MNSQDKEFGKSGSGGILGRNNLKEAAKNVAK